MTIINKLSGKLNNSFPALRHKNFRYFWIGQCVSLIGTWMHNIGQPWLVFSITKSPFLLGLVVALQYTPVLLFSIFAGVIVDRFSKKNILLFTQITSAVIALILAILVITGYVEYWHIIVLAAILGFVNALDMPARQSFIIELVGKEDLMNAIALNSSIFNAARIIGPALAGFLIGYVGIAYCFFVNALSFLAVIYGLFRMKVSPLGITADKSVKIFKDISESFKYVYKNTTTFKTLAAVAIVSIFAVNFSVLVPVHAINVLHQGEKGFGLLMSAMGIGSFIGAITLAAKSKSGPKMLMLLSGPAIISFLLISTGFTNTFYLTAIFLAFTGFFTTIFFTTANITIQFNTSNEFRGRVMSLYTLVFSGATPIGNLFAGSITDKYGSKAGFIMCGILVLIFTCILFTIKKPRY